MLIIVIAGLMITLPAIVVAIYFAGQPMMWPAVASLLVNSLPFVALAWFVKNRRASGDEAEEH